jgi:hypothetical protein
MKHLRRYNESIDHDELKDFVEDCLAYLLDEGFNVFIPKSNFIMHGSVAIWLALKSNGFTWDDIKDYYIPLLKLLSNRYQVVGFGEPSRGLEDSTSQVRFRLQPEYSNISFRDFPLYTVVNDTLFCSYSDKQPTIYSVGIMIKEK